MLRVTVLALLISSFGSPLAAAQRAVDPLIVNSEDPTELQQLAVQFIPTNQLGQALAALHKSVDLYPENAESRMWLGVVYTQLDDFDAGEAEFRTALQINPQLTETHNWFGVHWAQRGDLVRAVEHYRAALDDPAYPRISRARVLVNLGNVYVQLGDVEAAIPALSKATRATVSSNDPLYALMYVSLADALIKNGRPQEALGSLESLAVLPASPRGELLRGLAHRDLGSNEVAMDHLRQVLRLAPRSALAEQALEVMHQLQSSESR